MRQENIIFYLLKKRRPLICGSFTKVSDRAVFPALIYKKIRVKKLHKDIKSDILKKSKYKIDSDETYIYDNQIDLDMFSTWKKESIKNIRKKNLKHNYNELNNQILKLCKYGPKMFKLEENKLLFNSSDHRTDIYVSMKNPDKELNDILSNIISFNYAKNI